MVNIVKKSEPAPAPTSDGVEPLAALAAEAAALEATPTEAAQVAQQQQAQQQQAATANTANELQQTLVMVRAMVLPVLPDHQRGKLADVWSDKVLEQASKAGAEVMTLHGWTLGDVMGKYAPYIALAAALAPPTLATVRIMKEPAPAPKANNDGQQQPA
jgi:hypothetical protein